jgi:hypothetical protein
MLAWWRRFVNAFKVRKPDRLDIEPAPDVDPIEEIMRIIGERNRARSKVLRLPGGPRPEGRRQPP